MNTIILAHILSIVFITLGLSMIFNKKWTAQVIQELVAGSSVLWIAGLLTVLLGAMIVTLNVPVNTNLAIYIEILGWMTLIKGMMIMIFPQQTTLYYKKMNVTNAFTWGGIFVVILGILLVL